MATPIEAASARTRDVILRDGRTLRLRPPAASDHERVRQFFAGLSERSRYLRFHGFRDVDDALVRAQLEPDWDELGVLIGELDRDGSPEVVALASYIRLRDRSRAEVAFAVTDELQGHGVGTRLLEQLAHDAQRSGIAVFEAETLATDAPMLRVFEGAGFAIRRRREGGTVETELQIESSDDYLARVDARDHVGISASLQPFFHPASVAVVGASPRPGSIGGELFRNIISGGFTGVAYPLNRPGAPVSGVAGFADWSRLPGPVDLAVVCVPGPAVLDAVGAALDHGVRAVCVISAGFAETGADGAALQERLLARVRGAGARLIGPNCLGLAVAGVRMNATFAARSFPPGRIGFSSQSGALGLAVLETATRRGLGLSAFVSVGNKADISSNDLLEFWEDDPETDLVLLYMESFGNPERFGRIARRVARTKPILALKGGTTSQGARAAGSHTAAMAGSDAAVDALFRQAGVIRSRTLEELLDVASLLSSQPLPKGNRVAIVSNAGGLGILCTDACVGAGLELAGLSADTQRRLREVLPAEASVANPVDMLGSATAATYEQALPVVLSDETVDAVIVLFVPPVVATASDVAEALTRAVAAAEWTTPVLGVIVGDHTVGPGEGYARFEYPESAARALGRVVERRLWLRRPAGTVPRLDDLRRADARELVEVALGSAASAWLDADTAWAVLGCYGIPCVPQRTAGSAAAAAAAASELGLPAVVKTAAAGVHKSDTGGVELGLRSARAVRAAAARIGPPVVVQAMASGGVELLAGVVRDPVFGPLIAFGPGGTQAELFRDTRFSLAPLTDVDARELVAAGAAGRLVRGFRGAPPCDQAALAGVLHRLAALATDLPEVSELDLNPLIAGPDGCVAVDARVRVARDRRDPGRKTW